LARPGAAEIIRITESLIEDRPIGTRAFYERALLDEAAVAAASVPGGEDRGARVVDLRHRRPVVALDAPLGDDDRAPEGPRPSLSRASTCATRGRDT
jgi:hypothetical protein